MATVVETKLLTVEEFMAAEEPPILRNEGAIIENLAELPGFRCPVSDLFA